MSQTHKTFQATCPTSGPLAACATLTAATGPTSSRRTSTVGSGPRTKLVSAPPTVPPSATGLAPEGSAPRGLSLTTGSRFSRWLIFQA